MDERERETERTVDEGEGENGMQIASASDAERPAHNVI